MGVGDLEGEDGGWKQAGARRRGLVEGSKWGKGGPTLRRGRRLLCSFARRDVVWESAGWGSGICGRGLRNVCVAKG